MTLYHEELALVNENFDLMVGIFEHLNIKYMLMKGYNLFVIKPLIRKVMYIIPIIICTLEGLKGDKL